jgi:hypothetical protein
MCDPATALIISSAISGGSGVGSSLINKHKGGGTVQTPESPQPLNLPPWPNQVNGLSGSAVAPLNTPPPMGKVGGFLSKDPYSILPLLQQILSQGG